jgi:PAS domain S-box-containing protein
LAVVREIERRSHEHDELQDVQAHYQALFEQAGDAVFLATRGGKILDANPAAARLFGYEREKMVGLDARTLFGNPENVGRSAAGGRGSGATTAIQVQRQDRTTFWAVILATPLRGHRGTIRGYQCVVCRSDDGNTAPAAQAAQQPPAAESAAPASPATADAPVSRPSLTLSPAEPEPVAEVPVVESPPADPNVVKRVLLASVNAEIVRQAKEALELVGIDMISVGDSPAAAEYLRAHRNEVSIVVIDFMPGQPLGHGALHAALGAWPKVPIVVLADESDLGAGQRLTLTSSVTFMPRPLHPLALIQRVRQISSGS